MNEPERLNTPRSFGTNDSNSSQRFAETPPASSEDSVECHDSRSLLEMWSGLHSDQISSRAERGYPAGDHEMLVVRNTFLELCKLAQVVHNPDRFVSAPAAYAMPGTGVMEKSQENAYNFPAEESTVMVRNIPTRITSVKLIDAVLSYRLPTTSLIDFLYLPIDFKTNKNLGYCFINFKSNQLAREFAAKFHGKKYLFCDTSEKMLQVSLSNRQGYHRNLEVFTQTKLLDTWPLQYRPLAELQNQLVPIDSVILTRILAPCVQDD
jgi:hypothetical protein